MTQELPPVCVVALFFDDIRIEAGGKAIFIGQYIGAMGLPDGFLFADRISVLVHAKWPSNFQPTDMRLRVDIPGQPSQTQPIDISRNLQESVGSSVQSNHIVQAIINMRFPPLRIGDAIDVWLVVDDHVLPAGRLNIIKDQRVHPGDGEPAAIGYPSP